MKKRLILSLFLIIGLLFGSNAFGRTWSERGFISRLTQPGFILATQMGLVTGCSVVSKFAENPAIQSATPADVWDYGATEELYTWATDASIDSISSTSASDTLEMVVIGLDINWNLVTQTATLTGVTRKALTTALRRIWRVYNNNGTDLVGNVYVYENTAISGGIPVDTGKVRAYVSLIEQQTLMSPYTVPSGSTAFFLGLTASISKQPSAGNVIFTGAVRPFGGVFRTQIRFNLASTGTSNQQQIATAFSPFPEKSDFIANADVSVNSTGVSVSYDLLVCDNTKLGF